MGIELHYKDGQTPLGDSEKDGLKIKSITTQRELDGFEQLNIEKAVEWTLRMQLKPEKILTENSSELQESYARDNIIRWNGPNRKVPL